MTGRVKQAPIIQERKLVELECGNPAGINVVCLIRFDQHPWFENGRGAGSRKRLFLSQAAAALRNQRIPMSFS